MAKRAFFIQWDSTNDCNLRCRHCYHSREGEGHEDHNQGEDLMDFEEVKSMVDDLKSTTERWGMVPKFHISGGEPMKRKDLMEIVSYVNSQEIEMMILTNGTLITKEKAKELSDNGIKRLQISIDGKKDLHNKIRGKEYAYDKAIEGIRNCAESGIWTTVSMTAMQSNKQDLEDVIVNSIGAGAKFVGFQSYVPDPKLGLMDPEYLGANETYNLFNEAIRLKGIYGDKIHVLQTKSLWNIMSEESELEKRARETKKFHKGCSAGFLGISVLSDGTIYPCRRLPIDLGNIKEIKLADLMVNNEVLNNLRDFDKLKKSGCCDDVYSCSGCRAIAYAVTGDYMAKDPMCFKSLMKK